MARQYQMQQKGKKPWENISLAEFKKRLKANFGNTRWIKQLGPKDYIYTVSARYRVLESREKEAEVNDR